MLLGLLLPREDWSPYTPGTKLGTYPCQSPGTPVTSVLLPGGTNRERSFYGGPAPLLVPPLWMSISGWGVQSSCAHLLCRLLSAMPSSWNLLLHSPPWLQSSPSIQADLPAGKESSQGMGTFPSSQLSPQGAGPIPSPTDSFFSPLSYSITWTFYCPFRSLWSSALFSRYSVWVTPLGGVFFVFMWEGELPMLLLCRLYPVLCVGIFKGLFLEDKYLFVTSWKHIDLIWKISSE